MNYKKIIILVFVFFCVFLISSLIRKTDVLDEVFKSETILKFESDNHYHDFKSLEQGKEASYYFIYENIGKTDLKIENITSGCGCTIPKWSRTKLKPLEKDSILVKYDSQDLGYFSKSIYVFSNSETSFKIKSGLC